MPGSPVRAPWGLARSAQAAVVAAAVVDVVRMWDLRARGGSLHVSQLCVWVMTAAVALFLVRFARCRRNADLTRPVR